MNVKERLRRRNSKGQAIVEYIIIVVIVAIAALTVLGLFSDRIRQIIGGAAQSLGADNVSGGKSAVEELKTTGGDISFE